MKQENVMIDALKTLFENDVVSSEIREQIEDAWAQKIQENKMQATAELREEFAQKYEHDKSTMVEAIDSLLSERLAEEIAEFAEDRKQLAEAKAKYAVAMRENANLLKGFVAENLANEIKELRADKKAMAENYARLEEFVVESLAGEIAEFNEDKKDLAETKVRLVREAKSHFAKVKANFIERSATAVSEMVGKSLRGEIAALKEDIDTARRNDFGRKIFEAFANEYTTSHLNENSEVSKLMGVLAAKDKQLLEAKAFATKAKVLAETANKEKSRLVESARREKIMHSLVAPLGKDQREIMTDLLESVQTDRLQKSFDKYLPSVIDGGTAPAKRKAILSEGTEITGNRPETKTMTPKADDSNVLDLRRLAGLN
jgi:hypothetical protein